MTSVPDHIITDVILVDSLTSVPPGYSAVRTSTGAGTADLGKSKKPRYMCYKKEKLGSCPSHTPVLVAITVSDDGAPNGFRLVELSGQHSSKSHKSKKRRIYVKFSQLCLTTGLVTDIVISPRGHNTTTGFICVGGLNNLWIFCSKVSYSHASSSSRVRSPVQPSPRRPPPNTSPSVPAQEPEQFSEEYALSGVPFKLNEKLFTNVLTNCDNFLQSICYKTPEQIEQEYDYNFALEHSVTRTSA